MTPISVYDALHHRLLGCRVPAINITYPLTQHAFDLLLPQIALPARAEPGVVAQEGTGAVVLSPWLLLYLLCDLIAFATARQQPAQVSGSHLAVCFAFSADGQNLLTDGAGLDVFDRDALTGETGKNLAGHTANLTAIAVSPASATNASSDAAGVIKLWDVASGVALATTRLSGPYLGMNITGATGLTTGQRQALLALGTVDTAS